MPSSLLLHLIDSAVPADSYASMPFQIEDTDFMEESEEIGGSYGGFSIWSLKTI